MLQAHKYEGPPDWDSLDREVHCPLCDYNLRHATEARCAECGYAFEWQDVLDPGRRLHHYLFEHHPENSWRSFWMTIVWGFRPRRFWTTLLAVQPSNPRRLCLYGLIVTFVIGSCGILKFVGDCVQLHRRSTQGRAWLSAAATDGRNDWADQRIRRYGSLQEAMDASDPLPPSARFFQGAFFWDPVCTLVVCVLAWPWLTLVSLMIFRWSMARARVKSIHVLRCVMYSYDAWLWSAVAFLLITAALIIRRGMIAGQLECLLICLAILGIHATQRLWMAYRHYLRFSHALLTVLCSQLMVAMSVLLFLLFIAQ